MKSSKHHFRAARSVPTGKFVGTLCEGQMHGDTDNFWHGLTWRAPVQQIFVPVLNTPVIGRGGGEAAHSQTGSEHVLAKTGVWILRVEGIDQQRVVRFNGRPGGSGVEQRSMSHLSGNPARANRL